MTAITTSHRSHVGFTLSKKTRPEPRRVKGQVCRPADPWLKLLVQKSSFAQDIRYLSSVLTSPSAQLRDAMNILKCSQRLKVERCGLIMSSL